MSASPYRFAEYELDIEGFELRRDGTRVPLEPQVFEVLAFLVTNHDRIVTKDEIIEHVWPSGFISDAALNTRVMSARKAVGDSGQEQRLIRTIRGRGYRFVGDLANGEQRAAAPAAAPRPVPAVAAGPGSTAGATPRLELDVAPTSFVGREAELRRLEELLGRPPVRLVTIAGPGGVGKTRLAATLAEHLAESGRDVARMSAASLQEEHDLLAGLAAALGVTVPTPDPATIAERIGDRPVVLILDNLEHILEPAVTAVTGLLAGTTALRIVATSREVLGLREEWLVAIGGLPIDWDAGLPDAARLFLDREAQTGAEPVEDEDDPDLRRICELVDGMPLAIELAASLRRYLPRHDIARQIERDLQVLATDLRNVPVRHRSIPGLLEESCRHLSEEHLRTLLRLSVFEGSFTLRSAEQVALAPPGAVAALVDRSLVSPVRGRFSLHPLLRHYARERLGDELEQLRERHADHVAAFLSAREPDLEAARQVEAAEEIDADFPNVLAAWRWMCAHERTDLLQASGQALAMYAQVRARWPEVRSAFEEAVRAAGRAGDDAWPTLAGLLTQYAWALMRTSRGNEIIHASNHARRLYASHDAATPPGFGADPLAITAMVHWALGRHEAMRSTAYEVLERAEKHGGPMAQAHALWLLGTAANRLVELRWVTGEGRAGRYTPAGPQAEKFLDEAESALGRADRLLEARGERWLRAFIARERSNSANARGRSEHSLRLMHECYELRTAVGDIDGIADALVELAGRSIDTMDTAAAAEYLDRASQLVQPGNLGVLSELERAAGALDWATGNHARGLERAARGTEISLRIGSVNNVLASARVAGDILAERGDLEEAARIAVFVAGHPAATPFSRARAVAAANALLVWLGDEQMERIRASVARLRVPDFGHEVLGYIGS